MRKNPTIVTSNLRLLITIFGILAIVVLGVVFFQLKTILLPLVVAIFGTFMLNPIIDQILKLRSGRIIEFAAIIFLLIIFFLLLNLAGYILFISIKNIAAGLPDYEEKLRILLTNLSLRSSFIQDLIHKLGLSGDEKWNWEQSLGDQSITSLIIKVLGSVFSLVSKTMLVIIYMLFILLGRGSLIPKLTKVLPGQRVEQFNTIINNIRIQIQRYIVVKTITSVITGALAGIVLYSFKVDFALVWIILTILLNFIPSIGSIFATILPVTIAFLSTGTLYPGLPVLIFLVIIQFIIGNIIDPRLVGDFVDVSPLAVLISLIFWGWLWGIIGMFLAIPIIVSIKIICENFEQLKLYAVILSGKPKEIK